MKGKSQYYQSLDAAHVVPCYGRTPVVLDHGKGATLTDTDGKKYIDFGAGIAVNTFGAADKGIVRAVARQVKKLTHASNVYYSVPSAELAKALSERTGCKKVYFSNSGAEANECAIKAARKYSFDRYGKGRDRIVTLVNSFHGRTLTTLSATGQDVFHNYFFPFTEGFDYAVAGDVEDTFKKIGKRTCAVMMELIQGEGGVYVLPEDYVTEVAKVCAERDVLLIVDEVQTGNGRSGSLYMYSQYGIRPDIVTTAKGLAGGMPVGACMMFEKTADVLTKGTHGSTFGGNPVSCAAALEVLGRIDDALLKEVREKSAYLADRLRKMGLEVSGRGLMLGAAVPDATKTAARCAKNGLLILTAKTKLRLLPPLTITYKELDAGLKILSETLAEEEK